MTLNETSEPGSFTKWFFDPDREPIIIRIPFLPSLYQNIFNTQGNTGRKQHFKNLLVFLIILVGGILGIAELSYDLGFDPEVPERVLAVLIILGLIGMYSSSIRRNRDIGYDSRNPRTVTGNGSAFLGTTIGPFGGIYHHFGPAGSGGSQHYKPGIEDRIKLQSRSMRDMQLNTLEELRAKYPELSKRFSVEVAPFLVSTK